MLGNTVDLSLEPPLAKPSTGVSKDMAEGEVVTLPEAELVGRVLHDVAAVLSDSPPESSVPQDPDTHPTRQGSSSLVSAVSEGTVRPDGGTPRPTTPPSLPAKDGKPTVEKRASTQRAPTAQSNAPPSSITTSITNGITSAMRFVLKPGEKNHVQADQPMILQERVHAETRFDDHPHINYEWTIGKRLKFSCTAYYARQFDTLRQQCGLDDAFVKSLSRSSNWAAEGGKSKSNFWKTSDDRFIIKTLLDAWNVADLCVNHAFSYFFSFLSILHFPDKSWLS
jgi:1-phosphatidylinositol-3-phosphate 5-kinase